MNKYDPPPEVLAAQDHLTHVVNSVMQPQRIFDRYLLGIHRPEFRVSKHKTASSFPLALYFVTPLFPTKAAFYPSLREGTKSSFDRWYCLRYGILLISCTWMCCLLAGIFPSVVMSWFIFTNLSSPLYGGHSVPYNTEIFGKKKKKVNFSTLWEKHRP